MVNSRILWNGQKKDSALCFISIMALNLDELARKNLMRIMADRGLKQVDIAEKIRTTPQYLNSIIRGERGLGNDLMTRMCIEFNIEPWEFYWTEKARLAKNEQEQNTLDLNRKASAVGVAEEIAKYATFRIEEAKKKDSPGVESKEGGVPRRDRKRAG